jgi:hypothetical protein
MRVMISGIALALIWICGSHAVGAQEGAAASVSTSDLQREYIALRSVKNAHAIALHSYLLNNASDEYAYELNQKSGSDGKSAFDWKEWRAHTEAETQRANRYGASIFWCEPDADWTARSQGYLDYLSEWPNGPDSEEAWWRGKLGHKLNSCFDGEGSEEETAGFVLAYSEFLKHFPHGRHEREARELLTEFQADLDSYKQQKSQ